MNLNSIIKRANDFEKEAHLILAKHEASKSRIILLEDTYRKLSSISIKQEDLLRQALRCIEHNLNRAAHVMSWAALMDYIEELILLDNFISIRNVRPKWTLNSIYDLRENYPESQVIDAMREAGMVTKNESKALHGLLSRRNECAHPSDYYPDLNTTIGYISEIILRLESIQLKKK